MEKPAAANHPLHPLLHQRWSPRAFAPPQIPQADLLTIFEAARWAPSSANHQSWHFLVAERSAAGPFQDIVHLTTGNNPRWAGQAAVLAVALSIDETAAGRPLPTAPYNLGLAVGLLTVQAEALGIRVHQMAGFDAQKLRERFLIPPNQTPWTVIALGYPGDPATLPEDLHARELLPRERKNLESILTFL